MSEEGKGGSKLTTICRLLTPSPSAPHSGLLDLNPSDRDAAAALARARRGVGGFPGPHFPDPALGHTGHSLSTALSPFTDHSGPDLRSICSPFATVEQPPRRPPGPAHVFHKPLRLPILPPTTGYALGRGHLEVPSPTLPSLIHIEPCQPLPDSPASLLAPGVPSSGPSSGVLSPPPLTACVSFPRLSACGRVQRPDLGGGPRPAPAEAHPGSGRLPALCPGLSPFPAGVLGSRVGARERHGDLKRNRTFWGERHGRPFQVPSLPSS